MTKQRRSSKFLLQQFHFDGGESCSSENVKSPEADTKETTTADPDDPSTPTQTMLGVCTPYDKML